MLSELYVPFAVTGGLLPLLFLRPALRNRAKPGATGMAILTVAAVVYALAIAVRSTGLSGVALFAAENVVMLGASLGSVGWFLMFAEYTGLVSSTRRALYVLGGFVVLLQVGLWTNPVHLLLFDPIPALTGDTMSNRRPLFWVVTAVLYLLVVVGTGSMVAEVVRSQGLRRRQGLYMLAGAVAPLVTISVSGTADLVPVDITPLGFVIATAVLSWAMFRADFLEIVSVGRRRAIEDIRDPVVTLDAEDRVVDSNPAAREVFGAGDDWDGAPATRFFGSAADRIETLRRTDDDELSLERDGDRYHFTVDTTPIYGPQDRKQGQLVVFRDVNELKSRERRLRELTRRYDIALEATDTGVWEWDLRTDAVDYDAQMQRLFALDGDETVETYGDAIDRVHPADRDDLEAAYERGLEEGAYEVEFRVRTDGATRWLWVRGEVQHEGGEPVRVVGIGQDITDRKERERQLRRTNELLDEFASVVSHDVATPLGVIENKARLIEMTGETDHAADIYTASERVQQLVDELRSLAREGNEVGETAPVELRTVAREAWSSVAAAGVTLDIEASATVDADRARLRQLLVNLFENSVEHGSTGNRLEADDSVAHGSTSNQPAADDSAAHGATSDRPAAGDGGDHGSAGSQPPAALTVSVGTFDGGFYVADDGAGVPTDIRDAVFEQGYTTGEDGTGLGLAIVRRIVDGHGWDIAVTESAAGGARFEVYTDRSTPEESWHSES